MWRLYRDMFPCSLLGMFATCWVSSFLANHGVVKGVLQNKGGPSPNLWNGGSFMDFMDKLPRP